MNSEGLTSMFKENGLQFFLSRIPLFFAYKAQNYEFNIRSPSVPIPLCHTKTHRNYDHIAIYLGI